MVGNRGSIRSGLHKHSCLYHLLSCWWPRSPSVWLEIPNLSRQHEKNEGDEQKKYDRVYFLFPPFVSSDSREISWLVSGCAGGLSSRVLLRLRSIRFCIMRAAYKAATSAFRPPDPAGAFPGKKRPRFAQVLVHLLMFLFHSRSAAAADESRNLLLD